MQLLPWPTIRRTLRPISSKIDRTAVRSGPLYRVPREEAAGNIDGRPGPSRRLDLASERQADQSLIRYRLQHADHVARAFRLPRKWIPLRDIAFSLSLTGIKHLQAFRKTRPHAFSMRGPLPYALRHAHRLRARLNG